MVRALTIGMFAVLPVSAVPYAHYRAPGPGGRGASRVALGVTHSWRVESDYAWRPIRRRGNLNIIERNRSSGDGVDGTDREPARWIDPC